MTLEFAHKTALITGGGTGIGKSSALALAALGCTVTIAGRTISTLKETAGQITARGGTARYVDCDVADERSVEHAVDVAAGDSGRLDFGVDSAGAGLTKTTALDYGADGIRVNVIIAGLVDTPLIAEGRSPETAQDVTVPAEAAAA